MVTPATAGNIWTSTDLFAKTAGSGKRVLTDNDDDGEAPAVVQTPDGRLRVAWYNASNQSLLFAAEGHSSWEDNSPITIDSGLVGEWSDMALEDDGDVHLVYYDRTGGTVKYAYHAEGESWYSWTTETIDTVGDITQGTAVAEVAAIAVDSEGTPHVAYYSATGTHLAYARRTGADTWVTAVLDDNGAGDVGTNPSIAIDRSDVVHLVYYDVTDMTLCYNSRTAAGWTGVQAVEAPAGAAEPYGPNDLALDALGNPHVVYTYQLATNAKNLKHAWIDTGAWTNETVDADGTGQHGYYPKMAITQDGHAYIAYGINWAGSVYLADKAGVGEQGGPDLAVTLDGGGQTFLPGDTIQTQITITNAGVDPAVGEVDLSAGVAIDTGGGYQYITPYSRTVTVDLEPGESTTIAATWQVAADAVPGEVFRFASIDPDAAVGDTIAGNNTVMAAAPDEIVWAAGDVDGRTVRSFTVEDPQEDGDQATFSLRGAGTLSIVPGEDGIDQIVIEGTDDRSVITIAVKGGDGEMFVDDLVVLGDVATINAPGVFITGNVTIGGFCRTLILGTVDVGHTITINGDQVPVDPADLARNAVSLVFDHVAATAVDTNGLAIRSVQAVDWLEGSITAPWIGSITTTGTRGGASAGDLNVSLFLDGQGAPRGTALGTVRAAGSLAGGAWDITGNVGVVQAAAADGWAAQIDGDVKLLKIAGAAANTNVEATGSVAAATAAQWTGGSIVADQLSRFTVAGSRPLGLDGDCTVTLTVSGQGVAPGRTALGSAVIKGAADTVVVNVDGAIGLLSAAAWNGGAVTADQLAKFMVTGSRALGLDGDCATALSISGDNVAAARPAVGLVKIAGLASLQVAVDGGVGPIQAAAFDGATEVDVSGWIHSLTATGAIGGEFAAGRINVVKTRGDFTGSLDLSQAPDPRVPALSTFSAGSTTGARIRTAGNIGTFQTGTLTDSTLFAGWNSTADANGDGVYDLFDAGDAFDQQATIRKLVITRAAGQACAMDNSNIVAATIDMISLLGDVLIDETPGAEPFGIACQTYRLITGRDSEGAFAYRNGEPVDTDGNLVVRLV
ncbi:MAG: hypothetical protein GX591_12240 [Planctomycetes bacterium]|nr:hypothetical protein [Planctomycetota bacterium]